jgi:DNA polymerase-3 subunit alpha
MQAERIIGIKKIGNIRTVDIQVDNKEHIFYGNGIATSNSHAVEYSMLSYLTAHCKTHFPRAFYCSSLKHAIDKQKPFEEINDLVGDARNNSIDVYPPDIRNLNKDFSLISGEIYFGLGDIRGIGDSVLKQLKEIVDETEKKIGNRKGWKWLDFLLYISQFINSTACKALICSGALDFCKVARTTMYYEYEQFSQLKDREQNWIIKEYEKDKSTTLIKLMDGLCQVPSGRLAGGCSSGKRLEAVKGILDLLRKPPFSLNDSIEWLAGVEQELMGISLSCTKVDSCDISAANCNCREFINGYNRPGPAIIAIKIDRIKEIITKKNDKMAFLCGSDISGSIDSIVVFPNAFNQFKSVILENNTVIICGKRDEKNKSNFIVEKIWQL